MGNMWKCSNVHTWLSIDNYFLLEWWRFTFFFILKQVSAHMQLVCHIKFHVDFWRYWGERETKSREQSSLCSTWRNAVSNSPSLIPTRSTILVPIINPKPTSLWFPVIWASNRPILQLDPFFNSIGYLFGWDLPQILRLYSDTRLPKIPAAATPAPPPLFGATRLLSP